MWRCTALSVCMGASRSIADLLSSLSPSLSLPTLSASSLRTATKPKQSARAQAMPKDNGRVLNACMNCRKSKSKCIRTDEGGTCDRCTKKGLECVVDDVIRRRGRDRQPRTSAKRQEAARLAGVSTSLGGKEVAVTRRNTARRTAKTGKSTTSSNSSRSSTGYKQPASQNLVKNDVSDFGDSTPSTPHPFFLSRNSNDGPSILYTSNFPEFAYESSYSAPSLLINPTREYEQSTYWDDLIQERMNETHMERNLAVRLIAADLYTVFSRGDFVATMFHLPSFFDVVVNARKRASLEPALIYSLMAISYNFKGRADLPNAIESKLKSLNYAEKAHTFLMSAVNTSNLSLGLAQAAVCLQYYEFLPKPVFDVQRLGSCLVVADTVIRNLAYSALDADKVTYVLDDDAVPIKTTDLDQPAPPTPVSDAHSPTEEIYTQHDCPCQKWTYNEQLTQKKEGIRFRFLARFAHDESDEKTVRDEEIRRVVWGALNQSWYQQMFQPTLSPLFINDSSNYGIFLTSEHYVSQLPDPSEREWSRRTMYALLDRGKLLCHGAMRLRLPLVEFHLRALKIVEEADRIEAELAKHTCHSGIPRWQVSNVCFITRLVLTAKLRRMADARVKHRAYFSRMQAKKWLEDHSYIYKQVRRRLQAIKTHLTLLQFIGGSIKDAPMILGVLSVQALRCLDVFGLDQDLVLSLYVSRGILGAIEQLLHHHPCDAPDVQRTLNKIREASNFEAESIKRQFKPPNPPPHPPTVEELEQYIDEQGVSDHVSFPKEQEVDISQFLHGVGFA
ncbi:hypothetical protein E3P99_03866 [Wallemia hederae]|uniref:Zn(2)-C6 fungal-type domain-containing protein n=1 Tax=Wallemia hederae TaxID=1540922 RepID=A0A4T0FCN9_9BASI|nr:hypothetical protein E3P99_03866 [Wallemia hederae]